MTDSTVNAVARVLIRARERIRLRRNWTQRAMARGPKRKVVDYYDAAATCWCAVGAIHAESNTQPTANLAEEALLAAIGDPWGEVTTWNDHRRRTHAQVLKAFDKAIAAEEAR